MMDDRELLERAAMAAGIRNDGDGPRVDDEQGFFLRDWNPLEDDGDALRLAVKLRIDLYNYSREMAMQPAFVSAVDMLNSIGSCDEKIDPDPCAATRRAIVRAAAALGGE